MTRVWPGKTAVIILINILFHLTAKAQINKPSKTDSLNTSRAQNIFLEIGGPGLFFSANYDTRFSQQRDGLGARIGLGFLPVSTDYYITLPVQINYLLGKRSNFLEMGIGATLVYSSFLRYPDYYMPVRQSFRIREYDVAGTITLGYRYQPVNSGFNFRASFNPIFIISNYVYNGGIRFGPYGGISAGYTIK